MDKENLRQKLDTGTAYFLYCVILMAIAVVIVLATHIFTDHGIIAEIIAAFLSAIITAMITRVLLRQQTQSNLEMVEKQGENELLNAYNSEIMKDRMQYAHEYLNLIYEILADKKITEEEILKLKIGFQHIVYNAPIGKDINGRTMLLTDSLMEISETTQQICSLIATENVDNIELSRQLFILSKSLRETYQGSVTVDTLDNTNAIFKSWSEIAPSTK